MTSNEVAERGQSVSVSYSLTRVQSTKCPIKLPVLMRSHTSWPVPCSSRQPGDQIVPWPECGARIAGRLKRNLRSNTAQDQNRIQTATVPRPPAQSVACGVSIERTPRRGYRCFPAFPNDARQSPAGRDASPIRLQVPGNLFPPIQATGATAHICNAARGPQVCGRITSR
jgi:hypothetical protein